MPDMGKRFSHHTNRENPLTRIFQVIEEQTSLIPLAVLLVIAKHNKTKKRYKRTLWGKSDWEKTCDDGGKFFGW